MTKTHSDHDALERDIDRLLTEFPSVALLSLARRALLALGEMCLQCGYETAVACEDRDCPGHALGPNLIRPSGMRGEAPSPIPPAHEGRFTLI